MNKELDVGKNLAHVRCLKTARWLRHREQGKAWHRLDSTASPRPCPAFELQPKRNVKYLRVLIRGCHAQLSCSKQGYVKILGRQCGRLGRSFGDRRVSLGKGWHVENPGGGVAGPMEGAERSA